MSPLNIDNSWGIEVDFLAIGEKQSGDAICIRFGNLKRERPLQFVIVIDGGFKGDGEKVVEHLKNFYRTQTINLLVNSHPHQDHSMGMLEIIDKCSVDVLAIHRPWVRAGLKSLFEDQRPTAASIKKKLETKLAVARELDKKANANGKTEVIEPFVGGELDFIWCGFRVQLLNPTEDFYEFCLKYFACTPDEKSWPNARRLNYNKKKVNCIRGCLSDEGATSAENNTSTVLLITCPDGKQLLFTADAGMPALDASLRNAKKMGVSINNLVLFQIPHHGSVQNLGPSILKALYARSVNNESRYAVGSVCKDPDEEHPALPVLNAISDKNVDVCLTKGCNLLYSNGSCPDRGWESVEPVPHADWVQEFG